jgi:hypothetical protein
MGAASLRPYAAIRISIGFRQHGRTGRGCTNISLDCPRNFLHAFAVGVRITRRWLNLIAGICLLGAVKLGAVDIGMARLLVIHELGHPTSSVARGNTEIMTYPKGVRITLRDGKVTEVTLTTKTFSIVVGSFLVTLLLHALS